MCIHLSNYLLIIDLNVIYLYVIMPDRCCVPNCHSNYDKTNNYVSVYQFPKDEEKRKLWLRKIRRENFTPSKRSVVCEKHFRPEMISKVDIFHDKEGKIINIPRKRPILKSDAYPCIFEGSPSYLTEKGPAFRQSREEKLENKDRDILEKFIEDDKIMNFEDVKNHIEEKLEDMINSYGIILHKTNEKLSLFFINFLPAPIIEKSLEIDSSMSINIYMGINQVDLEEISFLVEDSKISLWSQLQNILTFIKNMKEVIQPKENNYETALKAWKAFIEEKNSDDDDYDNVQFIYEQMKLCDKSEKGRRYSSYLTTFAFSLLIKSTSCYETLMESRLIAIPSIRHLRRLTAFLNLHQSTTDPSNVNYIKNKSKALSLIEKTVNLLIDEIHIRKDITYKGHQLSGFALNKNISSEATTMQAFMISSLYSKYKEIIGLVPVSNLTANDLYTLTKQALSVLYQADFKVLCIISDNNRINRNMFKLFPSANSSQISVENPVDESEQLFVMFDSVHLIKSLRNNWINQLNTEKTFICPRFNDFDKTMKVSFSNLRKVFNFEMNLVIKYGHKLNFKAMYPTNIERQNVNLALRIFDESSSAAIDKYGSENKLLPDWKDTSDFLKIFKKWWDIMNINNPEKGKHLRNLNSFPFSTVTDERLIFLEKFTCWLKKWQDLKQKPRCGSLSEETFYALIHTTTCMKSVIEFLLSDGAKYVLTGKFQTDALESRFGLYRHMSGSNYHITVQEILENERKLRVKSILKLNSKCLGKLSIRSLFMEFAQPPQCDADISAFENLLLDLDFTLSKDEIQILTYIGGYCVHSLKLNCEECKSNFCAEEELLIESADAQHFPLPANMNIEDIHSFVNMLNRGGLKKPSLLVVSILIHAFVIFQKIISEEYEPFFQKCLNQHGVLMRLINLYIQNCNFLTINDRCLICNSLLFDYISKIINSFLNTCLKNYTKVLCDKKLDNCNERKMKKFKK